MDARERAHRRLEQHVPFVAGRRGHLTAEHVTGHRTVDPVHHEVRGAEPPRVVTAGPHAGHGDAVIGEHLEQRDLAQHVGDTVVLHAPGRHADDEVGVGARAHEGEPVGGTGVPRHPDDVTDPGVRAVLGTRPPVQASLHLRRVVAVPADIVRGAGAAHDASVG